MEQVYLGIAYIMIQVSYTLPVKLSSRKWIDGSLSLMLLGVGGRAKSVTW